MKIIELLNKIANGEEVPKKIKFHGKYYIWYDNRYTGNKGYCLEPLKSDSNSFLEINTVYDLNNEIEILEEEKKIPEKLDIGKMLQTKKWKRDKKTWETINSIIDYLKSKGE